MNKNVPFIWIIYMKNNIDSYKERVSNSIVQKFEYIELEVESKSL